MSKPWWDATFAPVGYPGVTVSTPVVATLDVPNHGDESRSSLSSPPTAYHVTLVYASSSLLLPWVHYEVQLTHVSLFLEAGRQKLSKVGGVVGGGDGTKAISVPGVPLRVSSRGVLAVR